MKVQNYDEVILQLEGHLTDYLAEKVGYSNTNRLFKCINPEHNDKSPSCGVIPGSHVFHCFSCGCAGNIFKAAHFIEQKPLTGPEFITETLSYLCEKYNIQMEASPLSEDDLYRMETYKAYRLASDYILDSGKWSDSVKDSLKERGWTDDICKRHGVGAVKSFKDFREAMKAYGFSAQFLDDIDLGRKEIFDDHHIIFSIRDHHGRPVGFASRNLAYTEDKKNGQKFVNQKTTGAKCNIYQKGSRLFGFDQLLKRGVKKSDPIYIFEGYGDVLSAAKHGLVNCCAVGGSAFTVEQLDLLKDHGYNNLILCLDGDDAGQKGTADTLDNVLGGHKDVRVSVVIVPFKMDPDDFIKKNGISEFKNLIVYSAFEWRLTRFSETDDPTVVCKAMIPLIVNEVSFVEQERMMDALARHTGVSLKSIQADVARLQNERDAQREDERRHLLDKLARNIQKNPTDAEIFLQETEIALYELARKYSEDNFSEESTLASIQAQKNSEEKKDGAYGGFELGDDLANLQEALCGEWKKDIWMVVGGKANAGKSSFLCKFSYEIARREENDAIVIYHSIDDTRSQLLPKFVCIAEGSKSLEINWVANPKYFLERGADVSLTQKRDVGYDRIIDLVKTGRLVIKDANDGKSLAYAKRLIKYYRDKYPGRNIIYILDNFHKLQDLQTIGAKDERVRFKAISTIMKDLATEEHCLVISTAEYRKTEHGKEATNEDIGETGQIEYDANIIMHLFNQLGELGDKACHYHLFERDGNIEKMPRVQATIGKNKVSSFKGKLWFDFYPAYSDFAMIDPSIPEREAKEFAEASHTTKRISKGLEAEDGGETKVKRASNGRW